MYVSVPEDYTATDLEGMVNVNTSQQTSVTILIVDNNMLEPNESVQIEISLLKSEITNCVILQPSMADITILDNDSELCIIYYIV